MSIVSNVVRSFIVNSVTQVVVGAKFLGLGAMLQMEHDKVHHIGCADVRRRIDRVSMTHDRI